MKHDREPFEHYLESFAAPAPPVHIVSRAMCTARRRRVRRRIGAGLAMALALIGAGLILASFQCEQNGAAGGAGAGGQSQMAQPAAPPEPHWEQGQLACAQGQLARAYAQGGMAALEERLDELDRQFHEDSPADSKTWSMARNSIMR